MLIKHYISTLTTRIVFLTTLNLFFANIDDVPHFSVLFRCFSHDDTHVYDKLQSITFVLIL